MNILIPHKWLLDYLETDAKPEKIQDQLSLAGPSVERIYDHDSDRVYDIEITVNRVDSMSVQGVAREAAVILKQAGIKARYQPPNPQPNLDIEGEAMPLPEINANDMARRVICIVIRDVQRTETPKWMAERLEQTDQNVHDSVIDITNYVTHEIGHPIHAFDYDQIMSVGQGIINFDEAKKGEKFTIIDGTELETVGGEIVFRNPAGEIIDLPSIKGTANTSINENTKNVLLLIEAIEPKKVRFASMTHNLRSAAAQLSEKNVDPHLAKPTLLRAVELYQELCHAKVASKLYDDFPSSQELPSVTVELATINEYLGIEVNPKTIASILEDLGCGVKLSGDKLVVSPPTYRPDMKIPADIVEEVARIYGYHELPSVLMDTPIPTTKPSDVNFNLENRIKRHLSALGWQEVYTY